MTESWIPGYPSFWIYSAVALTGLGRAFIGPSYSALFALVLPREHYARASGLGSSVYQFGLVAGPAVGGAIVGWAGKTAAYGFAAGLCILAVAALLSLRIKNPPPAESMPLFSSIGEGLRFVFSNQVILGGQSLDMFAVLFGGAVAMLPACIHDVYHYGPEGLGILRAAPAIGAVMTGLCLARYPINLYAGRWLLTAVAGFGVSTIGFALSVNFWVGAIFLMLSGVFDGVSVVMRTTILQLVTPDHARKGVCDQWHFYWFIERTGCI